MEKDACNVFCEEGELTAMVIDHHALRNHSLELDRLIGNEVIIDPDTAKTFKVKGDTRISVKVRAKNNPSLIASIATNFLQPLTDAAKKFLS